MLAIRFKIASEEDTKFMESFQPGFHPFDVLYQIKKNYDKCDIGYVPPRYERQLSSSTLSNIQGKKFLFFGGSFFFTFK